MLQRARGTNGGCIGPDFTLRKKGKHRSASMALMAMLSPPPRKRGKAASPMRRERWQATPQCHLPRFRHSSTGGRCSRAAGACGPLRSGANCITLWRSCKPTWTHGWRSITQIGLTKARCAVAGPPCKPCSMARPSGRKRSDNSTNRTIGHHQNGAKCKIKSKPVHVSRYSELLPPFIRHIARDVLSLELPERIMQPFRFLLVPLLPVLLLDKYIR